MINFVSLPETKFYKKRILVVPWLTISLILAKLPTVVYGDLGSTTDKTDFCKNDLLGVLNWIIPGNAICLIWKVK